MTTTSSVLAPPTLIRLDRCDRCSATARLIVQLRAGELLFCGHHACEYRTRLIDIGARLIQIPDLKPLRDDPPVAHR
jgi:hypothetical protein